MTESYDLGLIDCMGIYRMFNKYVEKTMGCIGLILNLICLIVFVKLSKNDSNNEMVKYLLLKSFVDAYVMLKIVLFIFFDCQYCDQYSFYATGVFKLLFLIYFSYVAQFLSMFCEFVAVFIRFVTVSQLEFFLFRKLSFKLVSVMALFYGLLFYSYKLFENKIILSTYKNYIKNTSYLIYKLRLTQFGISDTILTLDFVHSLVRDGILVLLILILNILTLIEMRRLLVKKKLILANVRATFTQADKAEAHLTIMILLTGLIAIIGHGLYFLFNIPYFSWRVSECIYPFVNFSYNLSYLINFFVYFFFNTMFRQCFLGYFFRMETNGVMV
jgi:hypothetical protein